MTLLGQNPSIYIPRRASIALAPEGVEASWLDPDNTIWEVLEDFVVIINGIRWVVPAGYFTDLASIPKLLRWAFGTTYRPAVHAAIFHDRCYSHWYKEHLNDGVWRYGVTKDFADDAFKAIMLNQKASRFVASIFHTGVVHGGRGGWE